MHIELLAWLSRQRLRETVLQAGLEGAFGATEAGLLRGRRVPDHSMAPRGCRSGAHTCAHGAATLQCLKEQNGLQEPV